MNSDDYKSQAESHDHNAVVMRAKADQVQQALDAHKVRMQTDIDAAQAQIDRLKPYENDSPEHAKEITDWQNRKDLLQQQMDRGVVTMQAEWERHNTALEEHEHHAAKAWQEYETAKKSEAQQQALRLAQRAQDPTTGTSSDQLAA